ncbi:carboxypeptidase regulatory-like domain-containing protein [Methylomonas fluvii]|uniref:Carboxypeptidase regulatory-like domain-containing protein n=1 Tax=Methylomonas fluvii TaxID=1854564 RepID=A0ABR9DAR6_9GAMM|nr:carboxypeptidase regulatory-like domain-containing protein [Methylomonas fluvii]MBD9360179.1 carboxypeptidase regulatory-like domain-containing protein [Methylomonas fluvii]
MKAVKVLETNILYASDVIYWLDGSSAAQEADMRRLSEAVVLQLDTRPADLQFLHTPGKTALWRRSAGKTVQGAPSEADKLRPSEAAYAIAGSVADTQNRYVPRRFEVQAGNAAGHSLVLYPTPFGTKLGRGGGLRGTLRFTGSNTPAVWALLTLTVNLGVGGNLICRAQSDANGDFIIAMHRLPPLPEGVTEYNATLSIAASAAASAALPVDPADLQPMLLGAINANSFAAALALTVVPGDLSLIRSFNRDHLAVQPN